jgi:hypothetical protein
MMSAETHKSTIDKPLRCHELIDQGYGSMLPGAPRGDALKQRLFVSVPLEDKKKKELDARFRYLRREAEAWHRHRTNYMMARLQAGRHPATHRDFWNEYQPAPPPRLSGPIPHPRWIVPVGAGVAVLLLGEIGILLLRWQRRVIKPVVNKR